MVSKIDSKYFNLLDDYKRIISKLDTKKDDDLNSLKNFINENFSLLSNKLKDEFLEWIVETNENHSSHKNCCRFCKKKAEEYKDNNLYYILEFNFLIFLKEKEKLNKIELKN